MGSNGRVAGKVAIVTGAASGIGAAIAERLGEEGARVVVADIDVEAGEALAAKLGEGGVQAVFERLDVTSEADWQRVVHDTLGGFGGLDILVNCAGVAVGGQELLQHDFANWRRILAINLDGVFLGLRYGGAAIVANGGGAIVNISSVASKAAVMRGAAYCASKAGVAQLTKVAALEWAPLGVRVNSVHPGYVETPLVAELIRQAPDADAMRAAAIARHPIGRLGLPREIANAVLFLASDEAGFATGAELLVDGGYVLP
ncbi:glucose 1-dehydrogenase [Sphingopyxis sp. OPL5]|uniref:glucose 1-dehydrogenase n=1 Tax=Sphingopyxis sp. OPL5 TaxID=2486273 RepID=UPI00164E088B|nr:glucose 1-dehydrogenase [Sphingopyxis sp. OPL5]QNO25643.1 glucose 1-dehydrogenase [Sphingopyxis sp. OPL5]